ncbi:NF-kappa-B-repressing factor-like [Branchiostoma floridae x Branchiostoma belcheri]
MADVEKHLDETVRDQWESPVQWDARKKFILHNWDQHPEDQLVCLSNVWANMEFLGCRYNPVVEQRVKEMAAGMPEFQKPELPQSSADQQDNSQRNRNDGGSMGGKRDLKTPSDPPHKRLKHIDLKKMINFTSGGVLGEEGRKSEEQPPTKQDPEGGSTFSDKPSTLSTSCSSMLGRTEVQGISNTGIDVKSSTTSTSISKPFVKPDTPEVLGTKTEGEGQIKETNIGNQMLRKMGWSGGGIGREGREGIAEPIKVDVMERRAGLGTKRKPFVKPDTPFMNVLPSILPENCVQRSLLVRKKCFFNSLAGAVRGRLGEISRATENHMHVFTQCVQQCRANPLYKIAEVTSSSSFVLESDRARVPGYACDLYVEDVYLARGYGKGKVGAKTSAVKNALDRLKYHRSVGIATRIDTETGNLREEYVTETGRQVPLPPTLPRHSLQGPTDSSNTPHKPKSKTGAWEPRFSGTKSLSDFVIYENAENAICILNSSAQFSKMNVTFNVKRNLRNGILMHQCVVRINQMIVADAWSDKPKDVKHLAAEAALSKLRQTNPVVKPRKAELTEDALTRTEVLGTKTEGEGQIKETNIGNQMLRKMGWSGGGIGREGREGIAEPIKVDVMERRAGLGTATELAEKQLISAKEANQVIVNYVQSGREDDLVFSPELTSDERAAIHKMARRYNLQHRSYGKGQKRYLVIRRKRTAQDVMAQAQFSPGQLGTVVGDGKYEVTLPQTSSWQ